MMATRRAIRIIFVLVSSGAFFSPAPRADAAVILSAKLADFSPWIGPDGTVRAALEVTNQGSDAAAHLQVSMEIHEGLETRSALENSFRGRLGPTVITDTIPVDQTIAPGETQRVVIEKPLPEIRFFASSPESRAYPVRLVVRSARVATKPIDTHMVFFSRPAAVPLGVAFLVPLHSPAVYSPEGRVATTTLQRSIEDGPIGLILNALEAHPGTPITIAPSGLLLDTLSDLSDGYSFVTSGGTVQVGEDSPSAQAASKTLERIKTLASREEIGVIASPYSEADLVWLSRSGLPERALAQVGEARLRAREILSKDPLPGWLLPATGALDETTLAALSRSGINRVILQPLAVPRFQGVSTRSAPVGVRTRSAGSVIALVEDAGLSSRLEPAPGTSAVEIRQRFLAETATIMLERPSESRVVVAVAPIGWSPERDLVDGLLLALHDSPWMRGIALETAVSEVKTTGSVEPLDAATILAAGPQTPPDSYVEALRKARTSIDEYSDLGPPSSRTRALERNLMIAESTDWWGSRRLQSRGLAFADSVVSTVRREFKKIRAPVPQTITLTSRRGTIPLVISTQTDYPVQVVIRLVSDKLRFPQGTEIARSLVPPAQTIDLAAVTEASGTFPLRVIVQTPNSGVEISSSRLVVRSTAYNIVALGITIGAGGFLVVGWLAGTIRRRLSG